MCKKFLEKHTPNLIIIGANDLKARFIKDQVSDISQKLETKQYMYVAFGDLSIPIIYSNSPISEEDFPNQNIYFKQAISLGRYLQNPMQEILQLWKDDISENYCLQIKLHPLQKYVNQNVLVEKMETKAIEVANLCGCDLNKVFEFKHMRNELRFISGLGPRKANDFIKRLYSIGKPKTREEIKENTSYHIGPKVAVSFLNFLRIKTDIKAKYYQDEGNLLDMTRIPMDAYDIAKKLINEAFKKGGEEKRKKNYIEDKTEEIIRNPEKLNEVDLKEFIEKLSETSNMDYIRFIVKLIKDELNKPFRDQRPKRIDLDQKQIFNMLIGDDSFQKGIITVAKVIRIDQEHVQCKLQNDLDATIWFKDIFENSSDNPKNMSKDRVKEVYKPGTAFEARIKSIGYSNYKVDLITKPSEMRTHKDYIPNVQEISTCFEITEEDKMNMPYINAHSQKNKKYQQRNINYEKFRNISYSDCCNILRNKDIGECIFRPSSIGINNLTLSYKFYKQIICHQDIIEKDKNPGDAIGRKLIVGNETYSSLDEIVKRYVAPCAQLIKESIKNRKFKHFDTKADFETFLREEKKAQPNIINYNYTVLKDFPSCIVLGYVPKVNPIFEYVKIKPRGLYFHKDFFQSLDDVTNYFKKEYSTEKYREEVRQSIPPTIQYNRGLESNTNNSIALEEQSKYNHNISMGSFMRDSYRGMKDDRVCNICKRPGHIAKNCQNRDKYSNDKRRDKNKNTGFLDRKRNRDDFKKYDKESDWGNEYGSGKSIKKDKEEDNWGNTNIKNDDGWGNDENIKEEDQWGNNENKNNIKTETDNNDGW